VTLASIATILALNSLTSMHARTTASNSCRKTDSPFALFGA
jgi:hypothetical protein